MHFSRNMKGTPEEKVLAYIATHDHKPLVFSEIWFNHYAPHVYGVENKPEHKKLSIKGLSTPEQWINFVLIESRCRESLYMLKRIKQCRELANRSSFDIWRHILFFTRDIDLFSVMRTLTDLNKVPATRQYCRVVLKRVFYHRDDRSIPSVYNDEDIDEYGLTIAQWRNIGK